MSYTLATGALGVNRISMDRNFAAFLREHAVKIATAVDGKTTIDRPQLAGDSVHFDRGFMRVHLPRSEAELHYRHVDVSSFDEMARRFWPHLRERCPRPIEIQHRAMLDAKDALNTARYWAKAVVDARWVTDADALARICPVCLSGPGEQCRPGLGPLAMGDYAATFHAERRPA